MQFYSLSNNHYDDNFNVKEGRKRKRKKKKKGKRKGWKKGEKHFPGKRIGGPVASKGREVDGAFLLEWLSSVCQVYPWDYR